MGAQADGFGLSKADALVLARGLGWFSIALGAIELLAPRVVARGVNLPRRSGLVAGYGLREIGAGVAILAADNPATWIWGRVGGDALDIATLVGGLVGGSRKRGAGVALLATATVTVADVICARALSR